MACAEKRSAPNLPKAGKRKVLIVDDHPIIREGLSDLINREADFIVCGCAADIPEALETIRDETPDVVTVDISLEKASGLDLIEQIKARFPDLLMLALSMHDELHYVERALRAGARGYVTKREATARVVAALRAVLQGQLYLSESMKENLLGYFVGGDTPHEDAPMKRLTDREMGVFSLLGQGKETREIAEQLGLSMKTVETYRSRIKSKLNLSTGSELLRCAFQWFSARDDKEHP